VPLAKYIVYTNDGDLSASLKTQGIVDRSPSPPAQTPTQAAAPAREDSDIEPNNEIELSKEAYMVLARYYHVSYSSISKLNLLILS
jgi:hypothetical protein